MNKNTDVDDMIKKYLLQYQEHSNDGKYVINSQIFNFEFISSKFKKRFGTNLEKISTLSGNKVSEFLKELASFQKNENYSIQIKEYINKLNYDKIKLKEEIDDFNRYNEERIKLMKEEIDMLFEKVINNISYEFEKLNYIFKLLNKKNKNKFLLEKKK